MAVPMCLKPNQPNQHLGVDVKAQSLKQSGDSELKRHFTEELENWSGEHQPLE